MGIQFTADQVLTMAPDSSSASAGKKLGNQKHWQHLGQDSQALWGECQGSALYQVRVELSTLTIQCSCPSRKQPCKHGIGLLLVATSTSNAIPVSEPPEWVVSWLAKRAASIKRKETKETQTATKSPSPASSKQAEKRMALVTNGVERLDLWLHDLIRNGLGSVETQPVRFWEEQAAQLVDAQAPGLASRLRRMAAIPNASPDWPEKLLAQLGQLALLTHAFSTSEQLEPALQEDVRQLIGWTLTHEEVSARGEHVTDDWLVVGQVIDDDERIRSQRTWLIGRSTERQALIVQFANTGMAFAEAIPPGISQRAELVFWPGAYPQRARFETRMSDVTPIQEHPPFKATIDAFLDDVATTLAHQPWQDRFLCTLHAAIPFYDLESGQWWIRDSSGNGLRLADGDHWRLLALAGGIAVDLAGEWDGERLFPLGLLVDNHYYVA